MGCWGHLFNTWTYKQRAHRSGFRSPVAGVQTDSWLTSESSLRRSPPSQSGWDDVLMWRLKRQHACRTHDSDSVLDTLQRSSKLTTSLEPCSVQALRRFLCCTCSFLVEGNYDRKVSTLSSVGCVRAGRVRAGVLLSSPSPDASRFLLCIYLTPPPCPPPPPTHTHTHTHLELFRVSFHCVLWRWYSMHFSFTIT